VGPRVRARLPPDPPLPAPMVVDCVPQSVGSGLGRLLCSRRGRLDRCQEPLLFGVGATPLLCAYAVWTPRRKVCVGVGLGFWSALLRRRRFSSRSSTAQVIVGLAAVSVSCTLGRRRTRYPVGRLWIRLRSQALRVHCGRGCPPRSALILPASSPVGAC
jgi:hypothetical protein